MLQCPKNIRLEKQISDGRSTPDSCRYYIIPDCGLDVLITLDDIYVIGCVEPIYRYFEKRCIQIKAQYILLIPYLYRTGNVTGSHWS